MLTLTATSPLARPSHGALQVQGEDGNQGAIVDPLPETLRGAMAEPRPP